MAGTSPGQRENSSGGSCQAFRCGVTAAPCSGPSLHLVAGARWLPVSPSKRRHLAAADRPRRLLGGTDGSLASAPHWRSICPSDATQLLFISSCTETLKLWLA
jgi:hypothetical protein